MFEATRAITAAAGLPAYEVSNHARPGAESRHNLTYWRYGDYAGVGPGAHGRRGGMATQRHRKPENWLAAIDRRGDGLEQETPLTPAERRHEALVMGLRLGEGVDLARVAALGGTTIAGAVDEGAIALLAREGLVARAGDRLRTTEAGMLVLNAVIAAVAR